MMKYIFGHNKFKGLGWLFGLAFLLLAVLSCNNGNGAIAPEIQFELDEAGDVGFVSVASLDGYEICYTHDGTDPTADATVTRRYTKPVKMSKNGIFKAAYVKDGKIGQIGEYQVSGLRCQTPTMESVEGNRVEIKCGTPGVTIKYVFGDKLDPSSYGTVYESPIGKTSGILRAVAIKDGLEMSEEGFDLAYSGTVKEESVTGSGTESIIITLSLENDENAGGKIYYTTDGSVPTAPVKEGSSTKVYEGPIEIRDGCKVQARAAIEFGGKPMYGKNVDYTRWIYSCKFDFKDSAKTKRTLVFESGDPICDSAGLPVFSSKYKKGYKPTDNAWVITESDDTVNKIELKKTGYRQDDESILYKVTQNIEAEAKWIPNEYTVVGYYEGKEYSFGTFTYDVKKPLFTIAQLEQIYIVENGDTTGFNLNNSFCDFSGWAIGNQPTDPVKYTDGDSSFVNLTDALGMADEPGCKVTLYAVFDKLKVRLDPTTARSQDNHSINLSLVLKDGNANANVSSENTIDVYYTTDGTDPKSSGTRVKKEMTSYSAAMDPITDELTFRAVACKTINGRNCYSEEYTLKTYKMYFNYKTKMHESDESDYSDYWLYPGKTEFGAPPSLGGFTKKGYKYSVDQDENWKSATGKYNSRDIVEKSMTFDAVWTPVEYKVRFRIGQRGAETLPSEQIKVSSMLVDGETYVMHTYDTAYDLPLCQFKVDGYVFEGWYATTTEHPVFNGQHSDLLADGQKDVKNLSDSEENDVYLYAIFYKYDVSVDMTLEGIGTSKLTIKLKKTGENEAIRKQSSIVYFYSDRPEELRTSELVRKDDEFELVIDTVGADLNALPHFLRVGCRYDAGEGFECFKECENARLHINYFGYWTDNTATRKSYGKGVFVEGRHVTDYLPNPEDLGWYIKPGYHYAGVWETLTSNYEMNDNAYNTLTQDAEIMPKLLPNEYYVEFYRDDHKFTDSGVELKPHFVYDVEGQLLPESKDFRTQNENKKDNYILLGWAPSEQINATRDARKFNNEVIIPVEDGAEIDNGFFLKADGTSYEHGHVFKYNVVEVACEDVLTQTHWYVDEKYDERATSTRIGITPVHSKTYKAYDSSIEKVETKVFYTVNGAKPTEPAPVLNDNTNLVLAGASRVRMVPALIYTHADDSSDRQISYGDGFDIQIYEIDMDYRNREDSENPIKWLRVKGESFSMPPLASVTKKGYNSPVWKNSDDDASSPGSFTVENNVSAYVQWTPNKYTVEYHNSDGVISGVSDEYVNFTYDEAAKPLYNPGKKDDNTLFMGWSRTPGAEAATYKARDVSFSQNNLTDVNNGKVDLYAVYLNLKDNVPAFDVSGIGTSSVGVTMTTEYAAELGATIRYVLNAVPDPTDLSTSYSSQLNIGSGMVGTDIYTIKAKSFFSVEEDGGTEVYTSDVAELRLCNVCWHFEDDSDASATTIHKVGSIYVKQDFTGKSKAGYKSPVWYYSLSDDAMSVGDADKVDGYKDIYAKWQEKEYTVVYYELSADAGSDSDIEIARQTGFKYQKSAAISLDKPVPSVNGKYFCGWTTSRNWRSEASPAKYDMCGNFAVQTDPEDGIVALYAMYRDFTIKSSVTVGNNGARTPKDLEYTFTVNWNDPYLTEDMRSNVQYEYSLDEGKTWKEYNTTTKVELVEANDLPWNDLKTNHIMFRVSCTINNSHVVKSSVYTDVYIYSVSYMAGNFSSNGNPFLYEKGAVFDCSKLPEECKYSGYAWCNPERFRWVYKEGDDSDDCTVDSTYLELTENTAVNFNMRLKPRYSPNKAIIYYCSNDSRSLTKADTIEYNSAEYDSENGMVLDILDIGDDTFSADGKTFFGWVEKVGDNIIYSNIIQPGDSFPVDLESGDKEILLYALWDGELIQTVREGGVVSDSVLYNGTLTVNVGDKESDVFIVVTNSSEGNTSKSAPSLSVVDEPGKILPNMLSASIDRVSGDVSGIRKPFNANTDSVLTKGVTLGAQRDYVMPGKLYDGGGTSLVGSQRDFYDTGAKSGYNVPVSSTCKIDRTVNTKFGDKRLLVYVADSETSRVTDSDAEDIADAFLKDGFGDDGKGNDIYDFVTEIFGEEYRHNFTYQIDEDDTIAIWVTDIDSDELGGTAGYFHNVNSIAKDKIEQASADLKKAGYISNELNMLVIDSYNWKNWKGDTLSTVAHEFQHMIHDSRQRGSAQWLNEMFSMLAEDIIAERMTQLVGIVKDGDAFAGPSSVDIHKKSKDSLTGKLNPYTSQSSFDDGSRRGRICQALDQYNKSMDTWREGSDDVLFDYGRIYAFGAYLVRNYGLGFLKVYMNNYPYMFNGEYKVDSPEANAYSMSTLIDALKSVDTELNGLDDKDCRDKIFSDWIIAALLSYTQSSKPYLSNFGGFGEYSVTGEHIANMQFKLPSIDYYRYVTDATITKWGIDGILDHKDELFNDRDKYYGFDSVVSQIGSSLPNIDSNASLVVKAKKAAKGKVQFNVAGMGDDLKLRVVVRSANKSVIYK